MLELDVRRTRDGKLVLCHDPGLDGIALCHLVFADLGPGRRLDTLEDALVALRGRVVLDVELKEAGYEADVAAVVGAHFGLEDALFSSFDPSTVLALAETAAQARVALIVDAASIVRHGLPSAPDGLVRAARDLGATSLAPGLALLSPLLIEAAGAQDVPLLVWTVNDPPAIRACLAEPRIGAVITDVPDLAAAVRRQMRPAP
jgi:glycerophosphoryl diester phosphodiesterase